jgi:hypothetical protein
MTQQRKQSHDHEKSRPCRIDNDAGCDLRSRICGRGRIVRPGLARSDRPLGPATATRLQCSLSGDGDADGRDQCAPLSWRTEIERLTSLSLQCCRTDIPGKRAGRTSVSRDVLNGSVLRGDDVSTHKRSTQPHVRSCRLESVRLVRDQNAVEIFSRNGCNRETRMRTQSL